MNFLASSNNGSLISPNGITWKNINMISTCSASNGKNTIMVGNNISSIQNQNMFVAVGGTTSTNIIYSYDGINWIASSNTTFNSAGALCIAYGNGFWIAGGSGNNLAVTKDPTSSWTNINTNSNTNNIIDIIYGNGLWIALYNNNFISFSTNPTGVWSTQVSLSFTANCVAYGFNGYIVGGTTTSAFSTYGRTWTNFSSLNAIIGTVKCITSSLNYWVAVGTPTGSNSCIAYCSDAGVTWTGIATTILNFTTAVSITFGNNMFIAVGGTGTYNLAYAYNSSITVWTLLNLTSMNANAITFNYKYWIVSGNTSKNLYYSTDGITWIDNSQFSPLNINLKDIASMNITTTEPLSSGIVTPISPIAIFNDLRSNYNIYTNSVGGQYVVGGLYPTPFMYPSLTVAYDQKWSFFYMGNGSTSVYIIQSMGINLTTSSTSGVVGSLSMANPTNNNNQLFTLTASGSGYKIQDYFGFYITSSSPSTLHASTFAEWQFFKCSNTLYKSINGICWGQGISNPLGTFVAVGDGNYPIMYSRDGFNWNGVTILEKSSSVATEAVSLPRAIPNTPPSSSSTHKTFFL